MLIDILWKIFRKSLSKNLYEKLRLSKLGRPCAYNSIPTYTAIFDHYKSQSISFENKIVLELGCGLQFFTAMHFLQQGAFQVLLIDPIFKDKDYDAILNAQAEEYVSEFGLDNPIDTGKIAVYSSLESVPNKQNGSIGFLCSHFVLEHFRNLENYFKESKRLLSPDGYCYSYVDLSDHTYHIFNSRKLMSNLYRIRMLYHLRYSDAFYSLLSDNRTWVNRLLFPVYAKLAADFGFTIINKKLSACKKSKIHIDVLKKLPYFTDEELYISHFSLLLKK